jgi:hypothetical protein
VTPLKFSPTTFGGGFTALCCRGVMNESSEKMEGEKNKYLGLLVCMYFVHGTGNFVPSRISVWQQFVVDM